jgi:predicted ATPase
LDIVLNGKELSINNVGYGVSQALPIIVELFSRGRGTNYAVQQPEVHLHPRAQAALGDVFFSLATIEAKRFFIETHSDYTIDRYRANFRKDNIQTKPPSQILFFERNSSGNFIHPIKIDENGDISASQPDSYRDFFIREQMSNLGLES